MIKKFRTNQKQDRYLRQIEDDLRRYQSFFAIYSDQPSIMRLWELIDNRLEIWLKVHDRLVTAEMDRRNDT